MKVCLKVSKMPATQFLYLLQLYNNYKFVISQEITKKFKKIRIPLLHRPLEKNHLYYSLLNKKVKKEL